MHFIEESFSSLLKKEAVMIRQIQIPPYEYPRRRIMLRRVLFLVSITLLIALALYFQK